MNFENEKVKWNNLFKENKGFKKELKKIENNNSFGIDFYDDLKIANNYIYGNYGIGYSSINSFTVKKIMDIFLQIIDWEKMDNNYFLVSSDGSAKCLEVIKNLSRIFDKKVKLITFSNYEGFDKSFVLSTIKKINPMSALHISESIFDSNIMCITLYDSKGIKVGNEVLEGIIERMEKNLNDIEFFDSENMSFLDNTLLIKIFVEKITNLFSKSNSFKKTKIAISNRSNGVTKILAKLIGAQDFSYSINNRIKNKNINLSKLKHNSSYKMKKIFWKDILFAKKEKANFLICFNQEGTQLFLFALWGSRVVYLNESLLSLIFLNNFYNDLAINNKNLTNVVIASNHEPSENINKFINKYRVKFRKILDDNFLIDEFLLIFWNDSNQFVFGEKINQEFSIYHFLIKIISIIDYYNNQYGNLEALFSALTKMYGSFDQEEKYLFNFNASEIRTKINSNPVITNNTVEESLINTNEEKKFIIEEIFSHPKINNEFKFTIKYNHIMKKAIVHVSYKKESNIIKEIRKKIKLKSIIKKIYK